MKWFILLFIPLAACSQGSYKVLEKSGKRPAWVNGAQSGYLIVSGTGATSEEAKDQCLRSIRDQIISAVAITVRSKTEVNIVQENGVTDEKFKYNIVSQSAKLPFLQGISLSKAKDSYWEKVRDTDKSIKYGFNVLYPFSDADLAELIAQFDKQEQELNDRIERYVKAVDTASSLSSIRNTVEQLNLLENTLLDDRKDKVTSAKATLAINIASFRLVPVSNANGELVFVIKNKKRVIKTYEKPVWKSDCAQFSGISYNDTTTRITYSYDLCRYSDNPKVVFEYNLSGQKLVLDYPIDVNANKVEASIQGNINIKKIKEEGNAVVQATCEFNLYSKYKYPFIIKRIDMKPEGQLPWVADGLELKVNAKGTKTLQLVFNQKVDKAGYSSATKTFPYLTVSVYIQNINTGQESVASLSNQSYVTDW